ncbi:MAG: acetoacetate--CoA ligase [Gammaproteobacteria bacterium]|nr:acetoacetate--CoA ligase [Gammaproteobacteria bacterium]
MSTTVIGAYCCWLAEQGLLQCHDYRSLWQWSVTETDAFWQSVIDYFDLDVGNPSAILKTRDMPGATWLPGASLSYAEHALRHVGSQNAVVGVSQTRDRVVLTRDQLRQQVASCARGLMQLGVSRGDRVAAYLPNIPEAIVAFLATATLGAVWVSCAPEFGVRAVIDRFKQVEPKVLLAVAGYSYGNKTIDRGQQVAEIRTQLPSLTAVVDVPYLQGSAVAESLAWVDLLVPAATPGDDAITFAKVPFDHPLYILFSSGTTGLPKAIVHSHGGMLLEHTKALGLHNDVRDGDVFFWFSTTGWMVWNYSVSALLLGAAVVCFDGNPMWPTAERLWQLAAAERMTYFGNSASFYMSCRDNHLQLSAALNLASIRAVGSTGSVLPAQGFDWIAEQLPGRIIASAAGGTDICSAFVAASPMVPIRSGEIACPMLGCDVAALSDSGEAVYGEPGELVIRQPLPSMPVGFWGDDGSRYSASYFEKNPGMWTHGDWITIFDDFASVISGRSDATLNRGGVRLGTADFYSVVEDIAGVSDSLVVHLDDSDGGMGLLILFVSGDVNEVSEAGLTGEIMRRLKSELSPRHVPDHVVWLRAIPRTLTGKKIETPVKKLLMGTPIDKVAAAGSLQNAEALHDILTWHRRL